MLHETYLHAFSGYISLDKSQILRIIVCTNVSCLFCLYKQNKLQALSMGVWFDFRGQYDR